LSHEEDDMDAFASETDKSSVYHFTLQHALPQSIQAQSSSATWTDRGSLKVTLSTRENRETKSSRKSGSSGLQQRQQLDFAFSAYQFTKAERTAFLHLVSTNSSYRIRIIPEDSGENQQPIYATSSIDACSLALSKFREHFLFQIDSNGKSKLRGITGFQYLKPERNLCQRLRASKTGHALIEKKLLALTKGQEGEFQLHSQGIGVLGTLAPSLSLRLDQKDPPMGYSKNAQNGGSIMGRGKGAMGGKEGGNQQDDDEKPPQSFFSKYKWYILPLMVFMMMRGQEEEPRRQRGQRSANAAGSAAGAQTRRRKRKP